MKLSATCYCVTGLCAESPWAVNAGFVVGRRISLIVDTGSNYLSAQTIHGYAQCASPTNSVVVINTEPHFDHIGGNSYFHEKGIVIYSHPGIKRSNSDLERNKQDFNATIANAVRKSAQESEAFFIHTQLANPTQSITDNKKFDLGGLEAVVYETPGHTPFNISVFIPQDRVLFSSDTVVTAYIPNLECGNVDLWKKWIKSLEVISSLSPQIIVPGHGPCLFGAEAIEQHLMYLKTLLEEAIATGKAPTTSSMEDI